LTQINEHNNTTSVSLRYLQ